MREHEGASSKYASKTDPTDLYYMYCHYGMNASMTSQVKSMMSKISSPSDFMFVGDTFYTSVPARGWYVMHQCWVDGGGSVDGRHNGFANILFGDGHAESLNTNMGSTPREQYTGTKNPYAKAPFDNNSTLNPRWYAIP
ncbi:hypothetical protein SDC9_81001 [bioreactor metagenome]|uniref:Uncharacterized protein n=1 Tax=bioreactor metagenome TaxID=1076179 RepID=A0A644Z2B0_9ZZZZ